MLGNHESHESHESSARHLLKVNPQDYRTWTSFEDHPIFTDRERWLRQSMDATNYDGIGDDSRFQSEWYVHVLPQLPVQEQETIARRDIENLVTACSEVEREFGRFDHELFILDDFTTLVRAKAPPFVFEVYPMHDVDDVVLSVFVDEPRDAEFRLEIPRGIVDGLNRLVAD